MPCQGKWSEWGKCNLATGTQTKTQTQVHAAAGGGRTCTPPIGSKCTRTGPCGKCGKPAGCKTEQMGCECTSPSEQGYGRRGAPDHRTYDVDSMILGAPEVSNTLFHVFGLDYLTLQRTFRNTIKKTSIPAPLLANVPWTQVTRPGPIFFSW